MSKVFYFGISLSVALLGGCTKAAETAAPSTTKTQEPQTLTRVTDASEVCMVNDQYMQRPQIPVTVGERTYYGCCEMCKGRLMNDASVRAARDPVTGATVDKALAVIGRTGAGKVYYFENEATLAQFASKGR